MVLALKEQTPRLTPALTDASADVRLGALQSLNQVANGWLRLRRYVLAIPVLPKSARQAGKDRAAMIANLDPLEPALKQQLAAVRPLLSEPDSRLRRAAATFLMLIDERALPMVPALIKALDDPDRAIRWLAARSLQNLPPEQIRPAVPYLAKLLADPDLTLRMMGADTLKAMGPSARAAVDALAEATLKGDADGRVAIMNALIALGPDVAQAAVPKLIEVLGQSDAEPKVIATAADTLAQIGPAAKSAVPALQRLMHHDSPEVRLAASEAILAIRGADADKK
jgi:HEAT repeat protein